MSENFWLRCLLLPILATSVLLMTGCGGCSNDDAQTAAEKQKAKEKKEKEKPKPNFVSDPPVIFPGNFKDRDAEDREPDADETATNEELERQRMRLQEGRLQNRTKPGHWVSSQFPVIANNFNATNGQFTARSTDSGGNPIRLMGTDFFSYTQRQASLSKGELKKLGTTVFLPKRKVMYQAANVHYLFSGGTGLDQVDVRWPHGLMHAGEFHMIGLSSEPERFRYLKSLDCVRMPNLTSVDSPMSSNRFYRVVIPNAEDIVFFPRNSLTWTTVAYLVWGDFQPSDFDPEQQKALLDWLHFGGQIVLSGPDALENLRGSFLAPFLPAQFEESINLVDEDFAELNANWSLSEKKNTKLKRMLRVGSDAMLGVKWKEHPTSKYLDGTSKMVIERQVGRGRVVATRFSIDSKSPVVRWRSYSSFFNACLLRKPARRFSNEDFTELVFKWANDGTSPYDPLLGSALRYVSRDLSPLRTDASSLPSLDSSATLGTGQVFGRLPGADLADMKVVRSMIPMRNYQEDVWHYGGFQHDGQAGVAGWNDFSGISNAARKSLQSAAGIDPPSPGFVLRMLGVYLLVLVPVNWLIFRLIGKVELAWVAAPIIAIAGAFTVVKMASLDIGFVRSQTQLGILEMYGDYPRGHLTEYSALYTSLSTRYAMQMENSTTLSLPFSAKGMRDLDDSKRSSDKGIRGVRLKRSLGDNRLEDFLIQSNFTGMLHTEMMQDAGGAISLSPDGGKLANGTKVNLKAVGVIYRAKDGKFYRAMIGELAPGDSVELSFSKVKDREDLYSSWFKLDEFNISLGDSRAIWDKNFPGRDRISTKELLGVSGIAAERILDNLVAMDPSIEIQEDSSLTIQKNDFEIAFQKVNSEPAEKLNLGGMLFTVDKMLTMGVGEYRMIGFTDDKLSRNGLDPKANQLQNKTMVLVHLRRPDFRKPMPDRNHWADIVQDNEWEDEQVDPFEHP